MLQLIIPKDSLIFKTQSITINEFPQLGTIYFSKNTQMVVLTDLSFLLLPDISHAIEI
jgi:hypothetical protein